MHSALISRRLAQRKATLIARSAEIRSELKRDAAELQPTVAALDLGLNLFRKVSRYHAIASGLTRLAGTLFTALKLSR